MVFVELGEERPNLSGLKISSESVERYGLREASTKMGRRIAVPYLEGCIKLLAHDGTAAWAGEYVPEAGLFGQRAAVGTRRFVLCAHEYEALRVATTIESKGIKNLHAVALPSADLKNRIALSMVMDSLKLVADELIVWNATAFEAMSGALEIFTTHADEAGLTIHGMVQPDSPLDLTDAEIEKTLKGPFTEWHPSSLSTAAEIYRAADFRSTKTGVSCGIDGLDNVIRKLRKAELVMLVAGTGVGKSTLLRQIVYHLVYREGRRCAVAFLEETKRESLIKFACIHFGIKMTELAENVDVLSKKQWNDFLELPATQRLHFIGQPKDRNGEGFGGMDVDTLLNTAKYLSKKHTLDFLAIDHISIMISGKESSKEGERKDIDILMTKLATACVTLDLGVLGISHLSNPDGRAHEEGGRVLLQHMRGSGSLRQLSWCVIAQERNQQSNSSTTVLVRVLKNRNGGGKTGLAAALEYRDPLLVERKDIDLAELANEMKGDDGPRRPGGTGGKRTTYPVGLSSDPFGSKPGRTVKFGVTPQETPPASGG